MAPTWDNFEDFELVSTVTLPKIISSDGIMSSDPSLSMFISGDVN